MMIEALGAKNRFLYKKNHQSLFTPTHEFMQGLIQATKVDIPDKREVFDSLEDVIKYKKNTKGFRYQTMFILNGRETTLAREILSEYFDKDINAYLGDFKTTLNSKNIILLYEQLRDKEDRLERIQKIQQFAAKIATLSGATAPRLSELYIDIDQTYLDRIKAIENNDSLDQKAKEIAIRDIYQEFQKVELDKIPEGVKLAITESSRAKLNQLRDMAVQQLNVGPDHKFSIAETTLVQGLSPIDYERHAIENRATQDIKQLSVPQSGYVTRQFIYSASEYYFKEGEDKDNTGIMVPLKDATGRTAINGEIIKKSNSDEPVRVRSLLTSTLPEGIITGDMLPNMFSYKPGSRIGMSLISSLTEGLTQSGLALSVA